MPSRRDICVRFGAFEIDAKARVLRKHGIKIRLQEQPLEVLLTLLETPGEIVTREQLRQRLWPQGTFVEFDHALNTAVKKIRAALCDDAAAPRYVETIPRRGYRFLGILDTTHPTGTGSNTESCAVVGETARQGRSFRTTIIAIALVMVVLILSAWVLYRPAAPKGVTLAVLPFSNMNSASNREGAATAVFPELLVRELRRTHPAQVVMRNSVRAPIRVFSPGSAEQPPIDYVLQGGVLGDEQHMHIAVQLVRLSDQNCVWARDFDRDRDDAETQTQIAEEIVSEMEPTLTLLSGGAR